LLLAKQLLCSGQLHWRHHPSCRNSRQLLLLLLMYQSLVLKLLHLLQLLHRSLLLLQSQIHCGLREQPRCRRWRGGLVAAGVAGQGGAAKLMINKDLQPQAAAAAGNEAMSVN
jgi:hypothetical protein